MVRSVGAGAAAVCMDCVVRWKTRTSTRRGEERRSWSKLIASALHELFRKKPPGGKSLSAGKRKATGAPSVDGGTASKKPAWGQAKTRSRLLHQAAGKWVVRGANDEGVAELTAALNALSVGAHEAAQGSGIPRHGVVQGAAEPRHRSGQTCPPGRHRRYSGVGRDGET